MNEKARDNYKDFYSFMGTDFQVWMGEMISYCEDVNLRLGD
jgi:hypothetical protein